METKLRFPGQLGQKCPQWLQTDDSAREKGAREEGNISIVVVILMVFLLGVFALTFDMGTLYIGQSQLQTVADSSARAALGALMSPDRTLEATPREQASDMARKIGKQVSVIQGGVKDADIRVEFGRFDFATRTFSTNIGSTVIPPAVRVTASRSSRTGDSGALRTLTPKQDMSLSVSSIAARRCRNVVLATDVSSSFAESIGIVQTALDRVVDRLGMSGAPDKVGLVAFRNIVVTKDRAELPVSSDSLVSPQDLKASGQLLRLANDDVSCPVPTGGSRFFGGLSRDRLPLPGCVGTNMAAAIDKARELFEKERNGPNGGSCENILVILSDGVPCKIDGDLLQARVRRVEVEGLPISIDEKLIGAANETKSDERVGGGSTQMETRLAQQRLVNEIGASIATIAVNTARENSDGEMCLLPPMAGQGPGNGAVSLSPRVFITTDPNAPQGSPLTELLASNTPEDQEFLGGMTSGFGMAFEPGAIESDLLARSMDEALSAIPPVTVDTTPLVSAGP